MCELQGEHQANNANCPVYKRRLEKLDQGTKKQPAKIQGQGRKLPPPRTQQHYPQLKNTKPIAWTNTPAQQHISNATYNEERKEYATNKEAREFQELAAELKKVNSIFNLGQMLRLVKTLSAKLVTSKTDMDRPVVFSEILANDSK